MLSMSYKKCHKGLHITTE